MYIPKTANHAPIWMSAADASAWAAGYNQAMAELDSSDWLREHDLAVRVKTAKEVTDMMLKEFEGSGK